jgi:nucleotide-binding universal stress UspA family protein
MQTLSRKVRSPFRRVLFASSFSSGLERALLVAFQFCVVNKASLRILQVCMEPVAVGAENRRSLDHRLIDKDAVLQLRQIKERANGLGLNCTAQLEHGVPSEQILKAIKAHQIDLVVLETIEPRGSKRLAFGQTAEHLMRKSSCPIMTLGLVASNLMTTNERSGPVVFATDFQLLTRKAIHLAVGYCMTTGRLHCLHILPRTLQAMHGDDALPVLMTSALKQLVATGAEMIGDTVFCVAYGSEISNAVVGYAVQENANLIFLGVRRDGNFSADDPLPIIYRIIAEAQCPVLTVLYDTEADLETVQVSII